MHSHSQVTDCSIVYIYKYIRHSELTCASLSPSFFPLSHWTLNKTYGSFSFSLLRVFIESVAFLPSIYRFGYEIESIKCLLFQECLLHSYNIYSCLPVSSSCVLHVSLLFVSLVHLQWVEWKRKQICPCVFWMAVEGALSLACLSCCLFTSVTWEYPWYFPFSFSFSPPLDFTLSVCYSKARSNARVRVTVINILLVEMLCRSEIIEKRKKKKKRRRGRRKMITVVFTVLDTFFFLSPSSSSLALCFLVLSFISRSQGQLKRQYLK